MDTSDPDISFDDQGVCNHCHQYDFRRRLELPSPDQALVILEDIVARIKSEGRRKRYDCIIGVSGGVDSSYVAYQVHRLGLRALAVHLDNGWNSELAVQNIEKAISTFGIDLHTVVLRWEEFRDLQRSFFLASVANCEMPTDHAILAALFDAAARTGTRYILSGSNFVGEGISLPRAWGHDNKDWTNISAIHAKHGKIPLRSFPRLPFAKFLWRIAVNRIRFIPILNYVPYVKTDAISLLKKEIGWREYGRKHGESLFTRYYQEHYLPVKFGFDKRRLHLSALVNSGQMVRDDALYQLTLPLFFKQELESGTEFFLKKLMFTPSEWTEIMQAPPRAHSEYAINRWLSARDSTLYKLGRKLATSRPQFSNN
jgi:N-acetyl sugar amidotransferase